MVIVLLFAVMFIDHINHYFCFRLDDTGQKATVAIQNVEVGQKPFYRLDRDEDGEYLVSLIDYKSDEYTIFVTLENGERYMALLWGASYQEALKHITFLKKGEKAFRFEHPIDQAIHYYRNYPRSFFKDPKSGEVSLIFIKV